MRSDVSSKLTHFTRGRDASDWEGAFRNLCNIIEKSEIYGSAEYWSGELCVCFTEAPLCSLPGGLVNPSAYSRYSPFGLIFDKEYLFGLGARPVIYGPSSEVDLVSQELRWRYMKYEPPSFDFMWEREWRIQCEKLSVGGDSTGVVVPSQEWADRIIEAYAEQQDWRVQEYSLVLDSIIGEYYRQEFEWEVYILDGGR